MQLEQKKHDFNKELQHLLINVLLLITAMGMIGHAMIGLSLDHLSLFRSTHMLLAGQEPYIDYADINPPLIHLLFSLPALTSSLLGLPEFLTLALWANGLIILSGLCCYRILRNQHPILTSQLVSLSIVTTFTLISFRHHVFADRDHLMLCFIAPWLLLHSPICQWQHTPARWRMVAAVMAAFGFALKPYFALIYPLIMLYYHSRMPILLQIRQKEHRIIWCIGAFYLFLTAVFFGNYFSEQFLLTLYTYPHYSWPQASKIHHLHNLLVYGLSPSIVWILSAYFLAPAKRWFILYMLMLNLIGICLYLGNAGWYYTLYTLLAVNTLTIPACAWCILSIRKWHPALVLLFTLLATLTVGYMHFMPAYNRAQHDIASQIDRGIPMSNIRLPDRTYQTIEQFLGKESRYLLLSTHVRDNILQVRNENYIPVGRYDHLWPLPGLAHMQKNSTNKQLYELLETRFIKGITADIIKHRPTHIVVETSPFQPPLPRNFDIISYLQQYRPFAVTWSRYRSVRSFNYCSKHQHIYCAFDIYKLKD